MSRLRVKGLETIHKVSRARGDDIRLRCSDLEDGNYFIHKKCRFKYCHVRVSSNDGSQQSFTSSAVCDTPANVEVRDATCGRNGYELRTRDVLVSSNDGLQQSFTSSAVCDTPANVEVRDATCGRDGEYQMRTRNRRLHR
jgi:hypothetical protein